MSFQEGILIENVQNFPTIWNTKHKEHRNLLVVENAWKSIAFILEESGNMVFFKCLCVTT